MADDEEEESEPEPPRNFTIEQLRAFDGSTSDRGEVQPVYLSLNGTVFDVSRGKDFYGPGGPYEVFAGRECGVALAKMSFDEEHLDNVKACSELNFGEKAELDGWMEKFQYYRGYPIVGRLITDLPDSERTISLEELAKQTGANDEIPEGYATAPIYVAVDGLVFDMSFGGVGFYGPGGPYTKFAGRDATRALALMKIDAVEEESADISDCTEKQVKTMRDWVKTFRERKKYPIVGRL